MLNIFKASQHWGLYMQANFKNAMALSASFWIDVIGMAINNVSFIIVWGFFFWKVGTINGWGLVESIGLEGFVGLIYGIVFAFAGGAGTLVKQVNNGEFDNLLLSPVNIYIRIISSSSETSAFGDILFGIILLTIFAIMGHLSLFSLALLLILVPLSVITMVNFLLVTSLLTFFIPDVYEATSKLFELLMTPTIYPTGLFSNEMKFFFLFIVPSIAISGMPIELVRSPNWATLLTILIVCFAWTVLTILLLKKSIRKYESGNLIGFKK